MNYKGQEKFVYSLLVQIKKYQNGRPITTFENKYVHVTGNTPRTTITPITVMGRKFQSHIS
jgi:hypothetical protein